jgi:hypothetical protein
MSNPPFLQQNGTIASVKQLVADLNAGAKNIRDDVGA